MNITQVLRASERELSSTAHLDDSARFRLLANERRRRVITALESVDGPLGLRDLAVRIGDGESQAADATDEELLISLHHVHLPKLSDAGVVEYDPRTKAVEPVERASA